MAERVLKLRKLEAAAAIARRGLGGAPRAWERARIPYPAPPAEPMKAYRCPACRKAGLEASWRCLGCGRSLCEHAMKVVRVNGTGYCRGCAWARIRAFNERFGLSKPSEPSPEEAAESAA